MDDSWNVIKNFPINTGLYRVKLSNNGSIGVAGCRNGSYLLVDIKHSKVTLSPQFSQRPICGVSLSEDGNLLALGSFEGKVYLSSAKGQCLWIFETDGEVWSVDMSIDGSLICIGSGDTKVYVLRNLCNSVALKEMQALEQSIEREKGQQKERFQDIVDLYLSYGLIDYGSRRLKEFINVGVNEDEIIKRIFQLLQADIRENPHHYATYYLLVEFLYKEFLCRNKEKESLYKVIYYYQQAEKDPNLILKCLEKEAECFSIAGFRTAKISCSNRDLGRFLDPKNKKIIYTLAISYEDERKWDKAAKLYEILISQDISYRDVLIRRCLIPQLEATEKKDKETCPTDYTGLTVSLLGPNPPRINEVDKKLYPILKARSKELYLTPEERIILEKVAISLSKFNSTSFHKKLDRLSYDIAAYLKYEYLLPSDEAKKQLEMVNLLSILSDNKWIKSALDIGTATGRYPSQLAKIGINAIGIDIEKDAILYAKKQRARDLHLQFVVGDASFLPFRSESFDLITLMMGTFAHFAPEIRKELFQEIKRVLRIGGILIISTWDIECGYLSFLSMYSYSQKQIIKRNSLTQTEIKKFLEELGFKIIRVKPFFFLSDSLFSQLQPNDLDLRELIEFDLAHVATFPSMHGQLFMIVVGRK